MIHPGESNAHAKGLPVEDADSEGLPSDRQHAQYSDTCPTMVAQRFDILAVLCIVVEADYRIVRPRARLYLLTLLIESA